MSSPALTLSPPFPPLLTPHTHTELTLEIADSAHHQSPEHNPRPAGHGTLNLVSYQGYLERISQLYLGENSCYMSLKQFRDVYGMSQLPQIQLIL